MSKLLIVESPTKARTIGKMLGNDYSIIASMGHIRDLPERELGVDIANRFAPQYVDTPRSKSVVKELRAAAKKADEIYLAPDPDREGEAIAWHLAEVLEKSTKAPLYRVSFHEITRSAIEKAMGEKGEININLVDAQQARRVLDRIVGYQVSPLLWSKIEKGSSAGRVQSVALRLVVERERAITAFEPEEYWVFALVFRTEDGREFTTRLFKIDGKDFKVGSGVEAEKLMEAVRRGAPPEVGSVTTAERKRYAPPPFTTSTLQQVANTVLRYSATNTMRYAQQLYEGMDIGEGGAVGLITYMVSGKNWGGVIWAAMSNRPSWTLPANTSLARATPSTSSKSPRQTGKRVWELVSIFSRFSASGASISSQSIRERWVMMTPRGRSATRNSRSMMSRSA